ncbi:MAG: 2-C-methyl-D-erythritol 2,4-cyclodiphosphate synthase [Acidimicrobiales bacterium]
MSSETTEPIETAVPAGPGGDGLDVGVLARLRVGHGFDVHPWATDADRPLVLGGVTFPDHVGLAGHSDADVVAHACTDAVLSATGHGDIGTMFPDTDPELAGADSVAMLRRAVAGVVDAGWCLVNVDCTVVLDHPKLAPHRATIEARLSAATGAPVTVKAKRSEGVGGLTDGVHGWAVALVVAP